MNSKRPYKDTTLKVYLVLRLLVIFVTLHNIYLKQWSNVFLSLLTLFLLLLPSIIARQLQIKLPTTLEVVVLIFIFAAEILGSLSNFYGRVSHWDTMLHTLTGFIATGIGFAIIDILNRREDLIFKLSPKFVAVVGFCFSMTIGVMWEFGEFFMDRHFVMDGQKDTLIHTIKSVHLTKPVGSQMDVIENIIETHIIYINEQGQEEVFVVEEGYLDIGLNDTMKDLFVNMVGSVIFSFFGWFYLENRDKYRFAGRFIPRILNDDD